MDEIEPAAWNRLAGQANPFLEHAFLSALERHECASPATGWQPAHLGLVDSAGCLEAAMPLYWKSNSWGEFVFDWGWADAYQRAGLAYYPKLLCAIPFTPVMGPRILAAADNPRARCLPAAAVQLAREGGASSVHVLFTDEPSHRLCRGAGMLSRQDCQFRWNNQGYTDFEDFLRRFSSAKRKKVRRERRRVAEAGIRFRHLLGSDLSSREWRQVFEFCASTFIRRGHAPYIGLECLRDIDRNLPGRLLVIRAERHGQPVAAAICFRGEDTLYGRYWGADADYHSLHFETCYYQGIEYCIREGLARFDPGTQGEHKLRRGFDPTLTHSAHWIADNRMRKAIAYYLEREREMVAEYAGDVARHLPFREDDGA